MSRAPPRARATAAPSGARRAARRGSCVPRRLPWVTRASGSTRGRCAVYSLWLLHTHHGHPHQGTRGTPTPGMTLLTVAPLTTARRALGRWTTACATAATAATSQQRRGARCRCAAQRGRPRPWWRQGPWASPLCSAMGSCRRWRPTWRARAWRRRGCCSGCMATLCTCGPSWSRRRGPLAGGGGAAGVATRRSGRCGSWAGSTNPCWGC